MTTRPPSIVVLGAGMSGLCMGALLKRAGIESFQIIERSGGVGGTWWDNVYPGAQCDVPSHLYSYSFEPNADWSRVYAPAGEIQAYAEHCADAYGLRAHLRLGTTLVSAQFDGDRALWHLTTAGGERLEADVFIASVGPLNHPRWPDGIGAFRGVVMHSARWDASYDARGRHVALIGSAASAVQIAPPLAAAADHLTIFQRTPSWILPRPDRAYSTIERTLFRVRPIAQLHRAWLYWSHDLRYGAFRGHGALHRLMVALADRHRRMQVTDPALRARHRPSYPMGCKRILISNDFYPALGRPNVTLVSEAATGFTADSILTADGGAHRVDAIVCATGFTATDLLPGLQVTGTGGVRLADLAAQGADAYRGIALPDFPNFFMLLGPNTGSGHTSILIAMEAQARYILRCLQVLARRPRTRMAVRREVAAEHNRRLQERLRATVWASPACGSWYKTAAGKVVALYPGTSTRYRLELRRPKFADFQFEDAPCAS